MSLVTIHSNARIHAALINESGYMGRIDGGIGFAIEYPRWEICVSTDISEIKLNVDSEFESEIERLKARFIKRFNLPNYSISVPAKIESHIGLGSKTALLLGIGKATSSLFELNLSPKEIAIEAKRGGTSGVGYWAFQKGGFVWDSGRIFPTDKSTFLPSSCSSSIPPELITSFDLLDYYVCHFRYAKVGVFGNDELAIFKNNCPLPHNSTKELLSIISGVLVPSLLSSHEAGIQLGIKTIQELGMKKIEWESQDYQTLEFKKYWESLDTNIALGLSSMGPTMYCLTKQPEEIRKIINEYPIRPIHYQQSKIIKGLK